MLETFDLSVEFSGFKAISDLNFSLDQGEVRVILGPNGAGKTTLMDLITGKTKPTSGKVVFRGTDITGMDPHGIARLGVGRKFQGPNLFDNMTVFENLEVALQGNHTLFKALAFKKKKALVDRIYEVLARVSLERKANHVAVNLSHGEKQWLEMGMILAQDPELIVLDEPTTGMTADETFKTGELIQTLFKGRSVLVIEHDMAFVRQIARVVTVLHQGKFLAQGTLQEIEQNQRVQEVYLKEGSHA
ncbi:MULTISPECIES: urea ABC transporter ATP-binding protein UrtD [unclassified Paenibacillus]|uniref:urea ABC transporter ATP-binding protein UrtD n=1 Tax=unclassified Paenibacillus TaxID=185978 RepID=UPI00240696F5|nr:MULTISPECIES: urea ABC transporter ATP-binding protein UrtD [unclassified Paenibacillus]